MAAEGEVVLRGAYVDEEERGAGLSALLISTWLVVLTSPPVAAHIGVSAAQPTRSQPSAGTLSALPFAARRLPLWHS